MPRTDLKHTSWRRAPLALAALGLAALTTSCASWNAEPEVERTVAYSQVPPGVQEAIDERLDVAKLQMIEMEEREGVTVYNVHGYGPNGSVAFTVTQDGTFVGWDSINDAQRNAQMRRDAQGSTSADPTR